MPCPPPVAIQRRVLRSFPSHNACTGDVWEYAVSYRWMRQWKKAVEEPKVDDSEPSSFDMVTSLESDNDSGLKQSVGPVTMADLDSDNFYVPESQWKLYVTWFGLDSKHTLQRRPVVGGYRPLVCQKAVLREEQLLIDRNLDFLPVWICSLKDLETYGSKNILSAFAWESLDYIGIQARRVLGVGSNKRTRLWFIMQEDKDDIVIEAIWNGTQSLISKVVDNVPEVVEVLRKRQNQIPPESLCNRKMSDERGNLSDVWFGDRILTIILAVEEIGVDLSRHKDGEWQHSLTDLEEEFESIMTISSIRNQWDDVLASQLDHYLADINDKTLGIKEELMSSARGIVAEKLDEVNQLRIDLERKLDETLANEQKLVAKETELSEREKELKGKLEKFKTGLTDFLTQKRKLEEELRTIEAQNKITDSKVVLNVGGHHFTTSVETLNKEDSLLAVMFSGRHALKRETDGSYFIDRDGTNFRYILNYLRDGPKATESIPENPKLVQEILVEAEYYKLKPLAESLRTMIGLDSENYPGQKFQSV